MSARTHLGFALFALFLIIVALSANCGGSTREGPDCTAYAYKKSLNKGSPTRYVFGVVEATRKDGYYIIKDYKGRTTRFDDKEWDVVIEE